MVMCLLPELEVSYSMTKSKAILSKDVLELHHLEWVSLNICFFSEAKGNWAYISLYPCSSLSSNTVI